MHSFHYQQGKLYSESTDLASLAEQHGTPLYVYSEQTILDHYRRLNGALDPLDREICYAVKANSNLAILRLLAEEGAGFDIVSGGELYRIITAGGDPAKCTFAGVGKTRDEIAYALYNNIASFNIESEEELLAIDEVASSLDHKAPIAVRVNPDVYTTMQDYYRDPTLRVDVEALERMQAFQIKAGFQSKRADVRSLVDLGYLPQ